MSNGTHSTAAPANRLIPPPGGAIVRMYRIGHGDCFLIAFDGDKKDKPIYVLIDCGYKPGSPGYLPIKTTSAQIAQNIREATGGYIDVAVITHEHQDHVNGITEKNFKDFKIGTTWMAWTEDPNDDVANELRRLHHDKLLGLIAARNRLAATVGAESLKDIDQLLEFELGDGEPEDGVSKPFVFNHSAALAAAAPEGSANKKSMKIFKDLAENGMKPLRPHDEIRILPGASNVRVYALGPPRSAEKLHDLDPRGREEFHGLSLAMADAGNYLAAAVQAADQTDPTTRTDIPFARRYWINWNSLKTAPGDDFFKRRYGAKDDPPITDPVSPDDADCQLHAPPEPALNADWRRIDTDWLSADALALDINNDVNNSSLVLAFELGKGGKVLLFPGDAQRGNWISWMDDSFKDGDEKITARDLLERTVLYKVGHHCSHNATLNGSISDDYPNLSWMGKGRFGDEFTAMITAVRAWAETQKGWDHPLKAIKDALIKKASGRVIQTDTDLDKMNKPAEVSKQTWDAFFKRTSGSSLYFDYVIDS